MIIFILDSSADYYFIHCQKISKKMESWCFYMKRDFSYVKTYLKKVLWCNILSDL